MDYSSDHSLQPHATHHDPLLDCLVVLTQLFGHPYTKESLTAGMPLVDNCLTPSLFIRSAKRANLSARSVSKKLKNISSLVLPAVLLLQDNQACVLTSINHKEGKACIILPETGTGEEVIELEKLEQLYSGYALFVKSIHKFEKRASEHGLEKPRSWFWGTVLKYKSNYIQIGVASLLINLFAIASPLFVMNVYDRVVPNNAIETLWALAVGVIIVFLFDFLMKTMRAYLIDVSGKKSDTILASLLLHQILDVRMECKPASVGAFSNEINSYENLREFFTSATLAIIFDLPFIFVFLWFISFIGGNLVFVPLAAVPIVIIIAILLEIPMRRAIRSSYVGNVQKQAILVESLLNLEAIKSLNAEGKMQADWEKYVSIVSRASLKSKFYSSLVVNITGYIIQMVTVVLVIYGVYMIQEGTLSMGGLIACSILTGRALAPLSQTATLITRFQQSKLGLKCLTDIMGLPTEREKAASFIHRPNISGKIQFQDVEFSYPNQTNAALTKINTIIESGEKVGIIGRIGSGKTTLQKLILGLYQAGSGSIRIDDIEMAQIDPADLRRHIGYVGQDASLFYGTVRENITTATPWASDEEIVRAAKLAGVDEFVHRHPAGYDMETGERGEGVSSGQRQAITIARAIIHDPQILLFDEPTSNMDNTSEGEFIKAMQGYCDDRTLILVTHKQTLLTLVDRLIIIDGGKLVMDGPKDKVLTALKQGQVIVDKK